jgi:hypothetical protein
MSECHGLQDQYKNSLPGEAANESYRSLVFDLISSFLQWNERWV